MRYLTVVFFLFCSNAWSATATLTWSWPTLYCDNSSIDQATWISAELIYSQDPMPMPSDSAGVCTDPVDPPGPAGSISIPISTPVTSINIEVEHNITYYSRIRVCYDTATNCSSWSSEKVFVIIGLIPNPPILIEF